MLYFVQQKRGDNPYLRLNVALCATIRAMFPDLKLISPKLLHKIQHYPYSGKQCAENVAFFAGFAASYAREGGDNLMIGKRIASCAQVCPERGGARALTRRPKAMRSSSANAQVDRNAELKRQRAGRPQCGAQAPTRRSTAMRSASANAKAESNAELKR